MELRTHLDDMVAFVAPETFQLDVLVIIVEFHLIYCSNFYLYTLNEIEHFLIDLRIRNDFGKIGSFDWVEVREINGFRAGMPRLVCEEGDLSEMVAGKQLGKGEVPLEPESWDSEEVSALNEDLHLAVLDEVKCRWRIVLPEHDLIWDVGVLPHNQRNVSKQLEVEVLRHNSLGYKHAAVCPELDFRFQVLRKCIK